MLFLVRRMFSSDNNKQLQKIRVKVEKINTLEQIYLDMSDAELRSQTEMLKARLKAGEDLDDILPHAFAVVREASKRVLGQRHYDVQMIGGIALHDGKIAEMKTGEGKTLVATLPAYLNALEGNGVHVVTVNDYLAKRDRDWMGKIYEFLGMSVGCILAGMGDTQRKEAYNCDITYGTNSEFGFDYLRDNMKYSLEQMVQRSLNFAIVDEVDSILIDEARTPLIISGPTDSNSVLYKKINDIIKKISDKFCNVDEKDRQVSLTEEGNEWLEKQFKNHELVEKNDSLYDAKYMDLIHHANQALKAHKLFKDEVDYIVKDGQVCIVDEFTGRIMEGRRFSDGLHQALEAKEGVQVQNENQTLASITYQNYFRMYQKLAGMTGTATTEASEFEFIYGLKTIEIPPNKKVQRKDEEDCVFKSANGKFNAITEQVEECYARKQPMLIGTVSIEKSELLSNLLKQKNIPHQILNAKNHEKESKIIAQAGIPGTITIATNMAGRGTDIMLGGNAELLIKSMHEKVIDSEERKRKEDEIRKKVGEDKQKVLETGGLYILGTERHESRRIDNQLRGRSGRQGDPGCSKFFLSMEDDLLRIFGSDKISNMLGKLGLKEDEAITHSLISKSVEKAQKRVENAHYDARKNILKYDDVVNEQRIIIFEQRRDCICANHISEEVKYVMGEKNREILARYIPEKTHIDNWNLDGLHKEIERIYGESFDVKDFVTGGNASRDDILAKIESFALELYSKRDEIYGAEIMRQIEKRVFLITIDGYWKEHLYNLDKLRQGISFRAYAQKDPLLEYRKEAFDLFEKLLYNMNEELLIRLFHIVINVTSSDDESLTEPNDTSDKIARNALCPCGSGKRYKHCCGKQHINDSTNSTL